MRSARKYPILSRAIKSRGMTIGDTAEKVLKCSSNRLYSCMSGRTAFNQLERERLAEFFGIPEAELFGG